MTVAYARDPSNVVNVQINIGPVAVRGRNFGLPLVLGNSPVIDVTERIRSYSNLTQVAADFGTLAPEYQAAAIFFGQSPQPNQIMVGRFAQTATSAVLHGAYLSAAQQLLSNFNAITSGGFSITVDGVAKAVSGLNFAACTSLSQVAAAVGAALGAAALCTWTGQRFDITSATTGSGSTIGYATAPGTGTDVSVLLGMRAGTALLPVQGQAAETPLQAAQVCANASSAWYGLVFALSAEMAPLDVMNVAAYIEGATPTRLFNHTTQNPAELVSGQTASLCYQLNALKYSRTCVTFSSSNLYAGIGLYGIMFTVNFLGSKTTKTAKFKQIIGVAPEALSESQFQAVEGLGVNVYTPYNNGAAIVEQGTMIGGRFFDEVHGLDWLSNYVQTGMFNLLYTSTTKIPQTDAGTTTLLTQLEKDLSVAVENGLAAPGVWNAAGFGQLVQGQALPKGFYTYAPPYATQAQADRDLRKSVPIQAAVKLAGAVHSVGIVLNINR